MSNISCYDNNGNPLDGFYQWDINREIVVKGAVVSPLPIFNFSNSPCGSALVVTPELSGSDLIAPVPNILLQQARPITLYICYDVADSFKTSESVCFTVTPRSKPDDYEYEDNIGDQHYAPIRTASSNVLGGVKIGRGLSITPDGTLSVVGGGSAGLPTYFLEWHSGANHPTASEVAANTEVLDEIDALNVGEYLLFLNVSNRYIPAQTISNKRAVFADLNEENRFNVFVIGIQNGAYYQRSSYFPSDTFDELSGGAASMTAIAEYIDDRLGDIASLINAL